ncbi:MAG TPA: hypothetical protein VFU02_19735, partial [Polyangiaceae bacterium]|nr:hypothetical protein [Polyangiaceae bacterium]
LVSALGDVVRGKPFAGASALPFTTAPMDGPPAPTPLRTQATHAHPGRTQANAAVTVDPDDPPVLPTTSYGWVIAAGLAAVVLLAGGVYWFLSKSGNTLATTEAAPSPAAASALAANVDAIRAPTEAPSASVGSAPPASSIRPPMPRSLPEARAIAPPLAAERPSEPPAASPALAKPPAAQPPPAVTKPSSQKPKTLTCVSDPFTGGLRLAKRGEPGSLPCKQNPFTGGYQRL